MKANKIASLLLAASIALAASACAVEFSDQNGTVDKVVNALASDAPEATAADTQVSEEEQKSTLDHITTDTTETTDESDAGTKDPEETSAETTPEIERTVIKENTCIEFEDSSGKLYTLDCKHGNFKVEPGDDDVIITFNGKTFELPISWDKRQVWPFGPVYVQRDGFEYIYVCSSLETDNRGFYHNLNVYKISGNDVTYVASTDGLCVVSQWMEDPTCFVATLEEAEEYGFDLLGVYEVGPDGMPVLMDDDQWFDDICDAISFPEEVSGYIVVDESVSGDTASIKPDDYVRLVATNGLDYLDVETKAGVRIRLDWTSIFKACDKNDLFYVAHAIDANIDDRIPCYDF